MTLPAFNPAWAIAGAKRSGRVRHHSTLPFIRAAMPATNRLAAAPSTAPEPPPATSCSAPSARPPPGSRESTAGRPNGRNSLACRRPDSIAAMLARSAVTSALDTVLTFRLRTMFLFCSGAGVESKNALSPRTTLSSYSFSRPEKTCSRLSIVTAKEAVRRPESLAT